MTDYKHLPKSKQHWLSENTVLDRVGLTTSDDPNGVTRRALRAATGDVVTQGHHGIFLGSDGKPQQFIDPQSLGALPKHVVKGRFAECAQQDNLEAVDADHWGSERVIQLHTVHKAAGEKKDAGGAAGAGPATPGDKNGEGNDPARPDKNVKGEGKKDRGEKEEKKDEGNVDGKGRKEGADAPPPPANDGGDKIPSPARRPKPAPGKALLGTSSTKLDAGFKAKLDEYTDSFGAQLRRHREEREMSREELAKAANKHAAKGEGPQVTAGLVRHWESSFGAVSESQFRALSQVLVDRNDTLKGKTKDNARRTFRKKYDNAASAGAHEPHDRSVFSGLLMQYSENAGFTNAADFAERVREKVRFALAPDEANVLGGDRKGDFISAVEAGVLRPSQSLTLALVSALNSEKELGEADKTALFAAAGADAAKSPAPKPAQSSPGAYLQA